MWAARWFNDGVTFHTTSSSHAQYMWTLMQHNGRISLGNNYGFSVYWCLGDGVRRLTAKSERSSAQAYSHDLIILCVCVCTCCDLTGSSEQHGSSASSNINVLLISPEKVSSSGRRRYETQVCQSITPVTHTCPEVDFLTDWAQPSHAGDHDTTLPGCGSQLSLTLARWHPSRSDNTTAFTHAASPVVNGIGSHGAQLHVKMKGLLFPSFIGKMTFFSPSSFQIQTRLHYLASNLQNKSNDIEVLAVSHFLFPPLYILSVESMCIIVK